MRDNKKSKEQLIRELNDRHPRVREPGKSGTDGMLAEETQEEKEEKYRALIETTDTGYLILDWEGKVADANREYVRLSGHTALPEIIGRSVVEWTAEYDRERNAAELVKCLQRSFVRGLEIDYVDREGRITPIEIQATVIRKGTSFQIVALCRDITARKHLHQRCHHHF